MKLDYRAISSHVLNEKIHRPLSGTLSGHAAGEPFEKTVYKKMKEMYPSNVYKQYEYLNNLFLENKYARTFEARNKLFKSELVSFLLQRGKKSVEDWSPSNLFEEKQNDTADIIYNKDGFFEIIDVKTRNMGIDGQAPNIISAYKLAQAMKIMLQTKEFNKIDIVYVEVEWKLQGDYLVANKVNVASIFKTNPEKLYINWAAAMQIQFHVSDLPQDFEGTQEEWARAYLTHYYYQALKRADDMKTKFADPFEDYINKRITLF